jgi:hypothetical protein
MIETSTLGLPPASSSALDRALNLNFIAADLPNEENRVILDKDEPHVRWTGHSKYAELGLERALAGGRHPARPIGMSVDDYASTQNHIQGRRAWAKTWRMGWSIVA